MPPRSLVFGASLLALLGCAPPTPPPARRAPRVALAVDGCDRRALGAVLDELGARRSESGWFRGQVPLGAPKRVALARCEVDEPVARCRARHRRSGRAVDVGARTRVRQRIVPAAPRDDLERALAARFAGDDRLEIGLRVREEVLTDPRVCVRERATRPARVPRVVTRRWDLLAMTEARAAHPDVVFDLSEPGQLTLRCMAVGESGPLPPPSADGPCAPLASGHVASARP